MKITIEPSEKGAEHFNIVTIDSGHDDDNAEQAFSIIHDALIAYGFHPDTVKKYLPIDDKQSVTSIPGVVIKAGTDEETGLQRLIVEVVKTDLENLSGNIILKNCRVEIED